LFCALNGHQLGATVDEAEAEMVGIAAGEVDESSMAAWLSARLD
jgi:prophage maintenance system killer protein